MGDISYQMYDIYDSWKAVERGVKKDEPWGAKSQDLKGSCRSCGMAQLPLQDAR